MKTPINFYNNDILDSKLQIVLPDRDISFTNNWLIIFDSFDSKYINPPFKQLPVIYLHFQGGYLEIVNPNYVKAICIDMHFPYREIYGNVVDIEAPRPFSDRIGYYYEYSEYGTL